MSAPAKDCRLPKAVVPSNYALHLTPDLTTFTFTGIVTVTVNVVGEPVSVVRCHAKELTFSSIVADGDNAASAFVRLPDLL